jgi:hypothetical protein
MMNIQLAMEALEQHLFLHYAGSNNPHTERKYVKRQNYELYYS